jgi:hypothetical protein
VEFDAMFTVIELDGTVREYTGKISVSRVDAITNTIDCDGVPVVTVDMRIKPATSRKDEAGIYCITYPGGTIYVNATDEGYAVNWFQASEYYPNNQEPYSVRIVKNVPKGSTVHATVKPEIVSDDGKIKVRMRRVK